MGHLGLRIAAQEVLHPPPQGGKLGARRLGADGIALIVYSYGWLSTPESCFIECISWRGFPRQVWFNFSGFIVVMSLGTWRALRWRAGCEATISTLKHPFSMLRASYKTDPGFQRYVGWCVITKNLFSIARYQERRRINGQVD